MLGFYFVLIIILQGSILWARVERDVMDDYRDRYDNILGINRNPSLGEHKCEAMFLREDQSCDQTKDVKRGNLSYFGLGRDTFAKIVCGCTCRTF